MVATDEASNATWQLGGSDWALGDSGPLKTAVLFVDMVRSTDVASVMGLQEYANFSEAFRATCLRQCRYFFEGRPKKTQYRHDGRHYGIQISGDELLVFLHTDRPHDDIYQLVCLAIALKCAWLGTPVNVARLASGRPTFELAAGIHSGPVWATRTIEGFQRVGFAINLTKRIEGLSRRGQHFRILVSDQAFKLVARRMRNLIFSSRLVEDLKGVTSATGIYELRESFVDPNRRLAPEFLKPFAESARAALSTDTFDLWIHSCIQVSEAARQEALSRDTVQLCQQALSIDPSNAVALLYAGEGEHACGNLDQARLYLEDLTQRWPTLADGWLALGRLLKEMNDNRAARRCILQARRYGAGVDEESLPE